MRLPKLLRRSSVPPRQRAEDGTATLVSAGMPRSSLTQPPLARCGAAQLVVPDSASQSATRAEPDERTVLGPLPAPGTLLGGTYRIGLEIAHGAMGVVLSAFDVNLQRPVAIKLVRAELLGDGHRQRLLEEARAMARVNHPNVVRIYAFGDHFGVPYIVMEQIDGEDLQHWLHAHAPAQPDVALRLLHEVCAGVSAIHAAGAVHRDLKPSNILLDGLLTAKVADFGACAAASGRMCRDVLGTPGYMPPEALALPAENEAPSPRSDVYSLGCIAYELLTGRHPFRATGTPPPPALPPRGAAIAAPSSICPHLPRALDHLLLGALDWDIDQRPASVEAFRQGLLAGAPHEAAAAG